jgi:glutamate N-acetyltransferase / amino-acid N-acetyltransferase
MQTELSALWVQGFRAAGIAADIKKNGKLDFGLIVADEPCLAVGVATTNQVKAAPVLVNAKHLRTGKTRAILVNAGNANAATGLRGVRNVELLTRTLAAQLGCETSEILTASTGVIGQQLPVDKMVGALPKLIADLDAHGFARTADSILTTDRYPKVATETITVGKRPIRIAAFGKGAGMIAPNMATMLVFVMTDAVIGRAALQAALKAAVKPTFNSITVDGDMSTNDTVLVLANGLAGNETLLPGTRRFTVFCESLSRIFEHLAKQMVTDGEGATKCVRIEVCGARSERDAIKVARQIGNSPLVKTAFFGEDANWGRIIAAAGAAGVKFDPLKVDIDFDDVSVVHAGIALEGADQEERATAVLKQPEFTVRVHLHAGRSSTYLFAADIGHEYIRINGSYRS